MNDIASIQELHFFTVVTEQVEWAGARAGRWLNATLCRQLKLKGV